ncbi:MAG: hypothetical protein V5A88_07080 [Candidatus Thermoplasmatota archaeon]
MKTYIMLMFNSEGAKPSEILDVLHGLGFEPQKGEYDMVYEWDDSTEVKEAVWFADKIHTNLEGYNVSYSIETVEE